MVKIKKVVDGVEQEVEVSEEEAAKLSGSQSAGVTGKETKPDNTEVDEKGVPIKNRIAEATRKINDELQETRRQMQEMQEYLRNQQANTQPVQTVERPEWELRSEELASETLRKERSADSKMRATLDRLQRERPIISNYRNEIESELIPLKIEYRTNDFAINRIVNQVLGGHMDEINERAKTRNNSPTPQPIQGLSSPTPTPQSSGEIQLTKEEIQYEQLHNLYAKGYTNEEIREQLNKRKKKK